MKEKHIPVGIYNGEVFIAEFEDGKLRVGCDNKPIFDVLRPVSHEQLDSYRDEVNIREQSRELWVEAVRYGNYEGSLDDYTEEVISESGMEDDEEMYPFKDDSFTQYLTGEDREAAEDFLEDVATWEASGCYPPDMQVYHEDGWYSDFKDWDFVFDNPEARKIARDFVKKFGKKK